MYETTLLPVCGVYNVIYQCYVVFCISVVCCNDIYFIVPMGQG